MQCCASVSTLQLFTCRHVAPVFRHCRGRPCPRPWGTKRSVAVPQLLALAFLGETEAPRLGQGQPQRGATLPKHQARAQSTNTPQTCSVHLLLPVTNSAGNATTPSKNTQSQKTPGHVPRHVHPAPPGARHPLPSPLIFWGGLFPSLSLPGGSAQGFQMPPGFTNAPPGSTAAPPGGSTSPGGSRTAPGAPRGEAGGAGPPPSAPPGLQPGASPPQPPLSPKGKGLRAPHRDRCFRICFLMRPAMPHTGGGGSALRPAGLHRRSAAAAASSRPRSAPAAASCSPPAGPTGLGPSPPGGLKAPGAALAAPRPQAGLGPGSSSTPRGGRRGAG